MLAVWIDSGPHAGAPLPPFQQVKRAEESALDGDGKHDGLDSGRMPTLAGL